MGRAWARLQKLQKAKEVVVDLTRSADHVVVVHYSCESFYDRPDGSSPRITSIAVRNLESGQTESFSIHQIAERKGFKVNTIEEHYNELERSMLDEFYDYVRRHSGHTWLHWNMRDINYGFQAIAHRYQVLGGSPQRVQEDKLVDLSRLLIRIYGGGYIGDPKLTRLAEKNSKMHRDFMDGKSESEAFVNQQYVQLHQSTLRKVDVLANIFERTADRTLKTDSRRVDIYGNYLIAMVELAKENPFITAVVGGVSFISAIVGIVSWLSK